MPYRSKALAKTGILVLPKRFRLVKSHEIHWNGPPSFDALFVIAGALSALSLKEKKLSGM